MVENVAVRLKTALIYSTGTEEEWIMDLHDQCWETAVIRKRLVTPGEVTPGEVTPCGIGLKWINHQINMFSLLYVDHQTELYTYVYFIFIFKYISPFLSGHSPPIRMMSRFTDGDTGNTIYYINIINGAMITNLSVSATINSQLPHQLYGVSGCCCCSGLSNRTELIWLFLSCKTKRKNKQMLRMCKHEHITVM